MSAHAEYGGLGAVDPFHSQPSKEKQPRETAGSPSLFLAKSAAAFQLTSKLGYYS